MTTMEYFHLTTPQRNIWNLQKYYEGTAIANQCGAIFYGEKRDSALLRQAVVRFIQDQSGLRLRFCEKKEPMQYVSEEISEIPIMKFASREEFDRYAQRCAREPLGLAECPMYRFVVFEIGEESGILAVLSHLVSDAWTFGLMVDQWEKAYRGLAGEPYGAPVAGNYVDFIRSEEAYQVSARFEKDRRYWEEKYDVCPAQSAVKLCAVPPASIAAERITRVLPCALERRIAAYCEANPVTQAVLFETALVLYLAKINPENKSVTIGVPTLNRSNAKEKAIAGMFVSTMPLTVEVSGEMTAAELERRIGREHMDIFRHQRYPYSHILAYLREQKNFSGNLYDAMVSYQNARTNVAADTKWYSNGYSEVPFVLHIDNRDGKDSHTLNVDYQTEVFSREEAGYLLDRLQFILEQIIEDSGRPVKSIRIVPEKELEKVVCGFNDTYTDYPREKCVHEMFAEQAARTPGRTALVFEGRTFTYRELDMMSNSLAHFLREKGVGRNDVVPIVARRSWHVVVAMLGVLKAGGAYMPVDPEYPADRIDAMIEIAASKIALSYGYGRGLGVDTVRLDGFDFERNTAAIENVNSPEDVAYVIFTSGSTGTPKGIAICHYNVSNYSFNNEKNVCVGIIKSEHERIVSVTNIIFDIFVTESILPLLNGMCIYFASDEEVSSQRRLSVLLQNNQIDVMQTTPTKMRSYLLDKGSTDYLRSLRVIILGGEAFPADLYHELKQYTDARIYNIYGPAETTVWSTNAEVKGGDITIGRPIANTQIYILGEDGAPLPIGVAGELCIAGDGVGKGYLNRPELTAERFVPNPFATEGNRHGKVLYHTGDLARWRADGEIEYLGRIDTQVKIRGLRIELGEIESVMGSMEGIGLAAAADRRGADGRQYLVGYYTAETEIDERKLRHRLSEKLPKYMVPNYFMRLNAMPMTPSGKIDRKNLPALEFAVQAQEYVTPQTETEERLAMLWQGLFHAGRVGRTDDFFALGGDSLLAISMLSEVEEMFGVELSVRDIMEQTTLEQLAQCIDRAHAADRIPAYHEKKYVLLPQQKAVYAACRKEPGTLSYNLPAKISLPEGIDRERLKESIAQVFNMHKLLKSFIQAEGDEIYGIYDESAVIVFEDWKNGEEDAFVRPFDLGRAPLVRVGFTEDALLFDAHHIVVDGTSVSVILRDIAAVYAGELPCISGAEYSDYARHFYGLNLAEHKAYFKKMLDCDFEPVVLPGTKRPGQGGQAKCYLISEEAFSKARGFAQENGLTDTMAFLGAYGILLSKYAAKKDILSSVILQNRTHADTRDMVGMFVNTLPVHLAVAGDVRGYMRDVKQLVLNLFRYQELPFWDIANEAGMGDKTAVNTSFVYQGGGEKALRLGGHKLVPQALDTRTAKFDLSVELTPLAHGCRLRLEYDCAKYDGELMDSLAGAYVRILSQLDKGRIADISVMSEQEYYNVTEGFNDTYTDYPREKCVHELFAEQAARTPGRTALVFEGRAFTYRELDMMSNSLAHFLREKGVGRNDVVPIVARRSWQVVVAMLGVLKAGGAYMPVDPEYPADRIAYMISETKAKAVLQYHYDGTGLKQTAVNLDKIDYYGNGYQIENCNVSGDMCYVLYTSGSAGKPKAAAISHANLGNFCNDNEQNSYQYAMVKACKCMLADTTFVFDISVFEIFLSLLNGLTVVLTKEMETESHLAELIEKYDIDVIHITPTKLSMRMRSAEFQRALAKIKMIMVGAEVFPEQLFDEISQYTDAAVYNGYGPTETTIGSSFKRIERGRQGTADITIGRPIANTQIYILGEDGAPLPIGVAGELCIAGDGVGKGYLNRPELTAERFVPNPFATEGNRHGKVLYHTGDLARWRADGEIEYLGRIDTQVKIRGLRIELGEIESVMGSVEGIGLTAAADRRGADGRQYLVGYYTAETEIDEHKLRHRLSEKLPKYMVPNYFMRLDAMPMTPSGKIDRKNLPAPDFASQAQEYIAPETEREKKLCGLLEELLHMERVGVTDDFFAYGGDSLLAIEYVARANSMGILFSLQNVFDYPTVRALDDFMKKGDAPAVHYEASDFERYQCLFARNVIDETFVPKKRPLGNVLLTGATGFLGAHVLAQLLLEETGTVYCLVRSGETCDRRGRLRELLRYYFGDGFETAFGSRIVPVVGDIERDGLAEHMPEDVQTVIHTAASVKHFGSYGYFRRVNTEGTRHVIEYAKRVGAKLIHISTLSVSGNSMAEDFTVYRSEEEKHFYETSLYIGQPLDNVYIRSKFEAERAVYDAMTDGLPAAVIRVGNLTNRASDFKFQPNYEQNAFLTRVKAILEFGLFPDYLMPLYSEFSPVDLTAEGIVKLAQYADRQCVFHLNSNRPVYFERFLEIVRTLGIPMEVVDGAAFYKALRQTMEEHGTEYIFEALQNDLDRQGRLVYDSNIHIDNDFTVWFLRQTGFTWPETDMEYIKGYIEYFRGIGYLKV